MTNEAKTERTGAKITLRAFDAKTGAHVATCTVPADTTREEVETNYLPGLFYGVEPRGKAVRAEMAYRLVPGKDTSLIDEVRGLEGDDRDSDPLESLVDAIMDA